MRHQNRVNPNPKSKPKHGRREGGCRSCEGQKHEINDWVAGVGPRIATDKMLRTWSQQARQLTPWRGIVAHLGNWGCVDRVFIYKGDTSTQARGADPCSHSRTVYNTKIQTGNLSHARSRCSSHRESIARKTTIQVRGSEQDAGQRRVEYIYIHVYIQTYIYIYIYIYVHNCIYICMYSYIYMYILPPYKCTHIYTIDTNDVKNEEVVPFAEDSYIYTHVHICIYTCKYIHTYIHVYIHTNVCTQTYIYVYTYIHIYLNVYRLICTTPCPKILAHTYTTDPKDVKNAGGGSHIPRRYTYKYMHIYAYIHTAKYVLVYRNIYVYMYICIYIYIHIHIYIYIFSFHIHILRKCS